MVFFTSINKEETKTKVKNVLSKYDIGFKATQNEIVVSKINHVVLIDGVKYVREDSK